MVEEQDGCYVVNVRQARWFDRAAFGKACVFEREDALFADFGVTLFVLEPGKPNCRYHRESVQEGFLVLSGRCRLLVNDEERSLEPWDYVHCPAGVTHVLLGEDGPCHVLAIGARREGKAIFYPNSETARRYGAQSPEPTDEPRTAYSDLPRPESIDSPAGPWKK